MRKVHISINKLLRENVILRDREGELRLYVLVRIFWTTIKMTLGLYMSSLWFYIEPEKTTANISQAEGDLSCCNELLNC